MLQLVSGRETTLTNPNRIAAELDKHPTIRYILHTSSYSHPSLCLSKAWLRRVSRTLRNITTRSRFNCIRTRTATQRPKKHSRRFRTRLARLTNLGTWEVIKRLLLLLPMPTSSSSQTKTTLAITVSMADSEQLMARIWPHTDALMFHSYEVDAIHLFHSI